MKKTLLILVLACSAFLIGCGGPEGEATVGGKESLPADPAAAGKKGSEAPTTPMSAPPGVKTGTPGG